MKTLVDQYNQGESVISVYCVATFEDCEYHEVYRNGQWCQTIVQPYATFEDMIELELANA